MGPLVVGGLGDGGLGDGAVTGAFVGALVGFEFGALTGALVGDLVGPEIGDFVGAFVGAFVGLETGGALGFFDGLALGAIEYDVEVADWRNLKNISSSSSSVKVEASDSPVIGSVFSSTSALTKAVVKSLCRFLVKDPSRSNCFTLLPTVGRVSDPVTF